jgi:hypothetical protein
MEEQATLPIGIHYIYDKEQATTPIGTVRHQF